MATLNGNLNDIVDGIAFSQKGRFIAVVGIDGNPVVIVIYFMAAFDNLGTRYYWKNNDATFTNAPTPVGSYVTNTLVIEGRIVK